MVKKKTKKAHIVYSFYIRLKFDDDRVTPATLTEVLEENYGGIARHPQLNTMNENRVTNAYMLVYIRESLQEQVTSQVTQNDIPHHLGNARECYGNKKKNSRFH